MKEFRPLLQVIVILVALFVIGAFDKYRFTENDIGLTFGNIDLVTKNFGQTLYGPCYNYKHLQYGEGSRHGYIVVDDYPDFAREKACETWFEFGDFSAWKIAIQYLEDVYKNERVVSYREELRNLIGNYNGARKEQISYISNRSGTLRGVSMIVDLDDVFIRVFPVYQVILVSPSHKKVIELSVNLGDIPEVSAFGCTVRQEDCSREEAQKSADGAYGYIKDHMSDPNSEVGREILRANRVVSSMELSR